MYSYQIVFHDNSTIELVYDTVDLGGDTSCFLATFMTDGPHGDRAYITDRWASPVFSSSTFAFRPTSNLPAHGLRYTLTPPPAACPRPISITVTGTEFYGLLVFVCIVCFNLIVSDELISTTLPFMLASAVMIKCFDSFDTYIKLAPLAPFVVLASPWK